MAKHKPGKNVGGRPTHEVTEQNKRVVILAKAGRMNMEDIAQMLDITTETLNKYYPKELSGGKAMCDLKAVDALMKGISRGDSALIKYYMNNQMGFSEKAAVVNVENNLVIPAMAIPTFNRILGEIATSRKVVDVAPALPDRSILSDPVRSGESGSREGVAVPEMQGGGKKP